MKVVFDNIPLTGYGEWCACKRKVPEIRLGSDDSCREECCLSLRLTVASLFFAVGRQVDG